ncbi:Fic family protein [Ramlibacter sp. AN1015]|uniref:Fic family protein n=1 Tax=Ramlibacter sp. AN1015 TaxID=3133428 RepID=UPI0030C649DE
MERGEAPLYVWQRPDWPQWRYDAAAVSGPLAEVSRAQGSLLGRLADVGMTLRSAASLEALAEDVVKTSAIEGEMLDLQAVRSSLARRLGVQIAGLTPADRHVEGVVAMVLDATERSEEPLTPQRLWGWHAALFPTGYSGFTRILVAQWRDGSSGPMQVVSGPQDKRTVHFEAPEAAGITQEMTTFLRWVAEDASPALLKSALAHLWFVTVHPFEDGNGRIARAVGDLVLARADKTSQRFYSVSAQIQREREAYYEILERTQKGDLDVTEWVLWFIDCVGRAVAKANDTVDAVLAKGRFWQRFPEAAPNERQKKLLLRLLDGFDGKLTATKWGAIAKCSPDTALRDINQLIAWGMLRKSEAGGRSTSYELG